MTPPTVTIVNTGIANTASVAAAFTRLGAAVELTDDPARARAATHLVLPGVGAFGPGIEMLRDKGLDTVVAERVASDRPTLCVCLGLQLLCATSDETPGATGLGVIDAHVGAFPDTVRTPQFGWNLTSPRAGEQTGGVVRPEGRTTNDPRPAGRPPSPSGSKAGTGPTLLTPGYAYFANSFRLTEIPEGWSGAMSDHAGPFVAALERGNTLACQFHPELSGPWGLALLERWMTNTSSDLPAPVAAPERTVGGGPPTGGAEGAPSIELARASPTASSPASMSATAGSSRG